MKNKSVKYLLALSASILTALFFEIIIWSIGTYITQKLYWIDAKFILILIIVLFILYSVIAKNNNKYSLFSILVIGFSFLLALALESIDLNFTQNYYISNSWLNLVGWNKINIELEPLAHRILGFSIFIYPIILIICFVMVYKYYFKRK